MFNKFFFFVFVCTIGSNFFVYGNDVSVLEFKNEIAEEIYFFKKNNKHFKARVDDIKIPEFQRLFDDVDVEKLISSESSSVRRFQLRFFLKVYPGSDIRSLMPGGLIMLTKEKTPKLNLMIKELSDKLDMRAPIVFLSGQSKMFNAFATSLLKSCSLMCLGEELINEFTDDELRGIIAHELAHIKQNHVPKQMLINSFTFMASLYPALYGVVKKQYEYLFCGMVGFAFLGWLSLLYGRYCEKQADMISARTTGKPDDLANAFKICRDIFSGERDIKFIEEYIESECADNPKLRKKLMKELKERKAVYKDFFNKGQSSLFASHPSYKRRIEYLEKEAKKMKSREN
jgi:Zn-dependent protease with chaperone function